ncbi:MAG: DUF5677 domain-containing protein [Myxococcota bacterium]
MSGRRKHPDATSYRADVGPRLFKFIESKADSKVENTILHALAVFSFAVEHLAEDATRHQDVLKKTGVLLVLMQDALRGLLGAQRVLSPVTSACLARNILETYCNLRFIYRSDEPAKWADRFARFEAVEKVLHENHRPPGEPSLLSTGERERILREAPEWFGNKGKVVPHWTADMDLKSLKTMAGRVGLADVHHRLYFIGSKFMHGSPLLANAYSGAGQLGALGNTDMCSQLSLLATGLAIRAIEETVEFYGGPNIDEDLLQWERGVLAANGVSGTGVAP